MKRFFTLIVALTVLAVANGKPVEVSIARRVAAQVLQKAVADATPVEFSQCYLFNAVDGRGFVLVSASDCVRPVLAYSHTGTFPATDLPDNLSAWLEGYMRAIAATEEAAAEPTPEIASQWRQLLSGGMKNGTQVGPLLTSCWNQTPYYNSLCPYDVQNATYTYTGCVATATAQIMRFWGHPAVGMGSHSYNHPLYGTLSARFDTTHYDWPHMPDSLNAASSEQEVAAVARLCSDVGIAVEMSYGPRASGASTSAHGSISYASAENALKTYFRYSPRLHSVYKTEYSDSQWAAMMKHECDEGRPVLYSGKGTSVGGHSFVLDGYDSLGYFHFNWGWGGYADGFYSIDSLNPHSGYSFTLNNVAVVGIRPASPVFDSVCTVSVVPCDSLMGSVLGSGTYRSGVDTVNLIARANEGYVFSHWAFGSLDNPHSFIAYDDLTDSAVFRPLLGDTVAYSRTFLATWHGGDGDTVEWAIRVPAASFTHDTLTEVQFLLTAIETHELNIYLGDSICPQTLAYHASIVDIFGNQQYTWFSHLLSTPLVLDSTTPVWITLRVVTEVDRPIALGRYCGNSDGSWLRLPDGWQQVDVQYDIFYSFLIRAIAAPYTYRVAASPNDALMGEVSGAGNYRPGDTCTLFATPFAPYRFTGWSNGSQDNPLRFVVTGDTSLVALFAASEGIGDVDHGSLAVSATGLALSVDNPEGRRLTLFDIMGRQLASSSSTRFECTLPRAGVYLVHADGLPIRRIVVIN